MGSILRQTVGSTLPEMSQHPGPGHGPLPMHLEPREVWLSTARRSPGDAGAWFRENACGLSVPGSWEVSMVWHPETNLLMVNVDHTAFALRPRIQLAPFTHDAHLALPELPLIDATHALPVLPVPLLYPDRDRLRCERMVPDTLMRNPRPAPYGQAPGLACSSRSRNPDLPTAIPVPVLPPPPPDPLPWVRHPSGHCGGWAGAPPPDPNPANLKRLGLNGPEPQVRLENPYPVYPFVPQDVVKECEAKGSTLENDHLERIERAWAMGIKARTLAHTGVVQMAQPLKGLQEHKNVRSWVLSNGDGYYTRRMGLQGDYCGSPACFQGGPIKAHPWNSVTEAVAYLRGAGALTVTEAKCP